MAGHVHIYHIYYLHYVLRPAKAPPAPVSAGHGYNIIYTSYYTPSVHGTHYAHLEIICSKDLLQPLVVFCVQRPLERRTKRELARGRRRRKPKRILKKKLCIIRT